MKAKYLGPNNLAMRIICLLLLMASSVFSQNSIDSAIKNTDELSEQAAIKKLSYLLENTKISDDSIKAKLHHFIGKRYLNMLQEKHDFDYASRAILNTEKAVFLNSKKSNSVSFSNLANSYFNLGVLYSDPYGPKNFDKASENYLLSIAVGSKARSKRRIAVKAAGYLAGLQMAAGEFEKAKNIAEKGIFLAQNQFLAELLICLDKKAECLRFLNQFKLSKETSLQIISLANVTDNANFEANAWANLGVIAYHRNEFQDMELYFKKATQIFKKNNLSYGSSMTLNNLAYLYYKSNEFSKSENAYQIALKGLEDKELKARIYDNLGTLKLKQSHVDLAISFFQKAIITYFDKTKEVRYGVLPKIESIERIKDKDYISEIIENLGRSYIQKYKLVHEPKYLIKSIEAFCLSDSIIDLMRQEHTGNLSKYYWRNKTRSLYESAIETCFLLKDYEKAWYFSEKSRAVMLNDKLNELGAKQKLSEKDQEKERDFQRKIMELNTKIEAETKTSEKEKLNSQLFDLQEDQERFVKLLEKRYPAYYQLKYQAKVFSLKEIQRYLQTTFPRENATLVEYFMGDEKSYAISVGKNAVRFTALNIDKNTLSNFLKYTAEPIHTKADLERFNKLSASIHQQIIAPLKLPKGHLIISQDAQFIPFEAIKKDKYLLEEYSISYTYSGQFLLKNTQKEYFWPTKTFLGFAPVDFKAKLNTLGGSKNALEKIAANYWFASKYFNQEATKANFLKEAKSYKIVQAFTHAYADSNETEPRIYFADSDIKVSDLSFEDVFKTQLLVLSACKTAVGKNAKGEGVLSLSRSFAMQGIPSTVTSLWSIEDDDTYMLTELFHQYLNDGLMKDEALQKAKITLLKASGKSAPYHWAGLVLVGNSEGFSSDKAIHYTIIAVLFTILTLVIYYIALKSHSKSRK